MNSVLKALTLRAPTRQQVWAEGKVGDGDAENKKFLLVFFSFSLLLLLNFSNNITKIHSGQKEKWVMVMPKIKNFSRSFSLSLPYFYWILAMILPKFTLFFRNLTIFNQKLRTFCPFYLFWNNLSSMRSRSIINRKSNDCHLTVIMIRQNNSEIFCLLNFFATGICLFQSK